MSQWLVTLLKGAYVNKLVSAWIIFDLELKIIINIIQHKTVQTTTNKNKNIIIIYIDSKEGLRMVRSTIWVDKLIIGIIRGRNEATHGSCGDHQKSNINELIWKYQTVVYLHLFIWHPLHILWLYFESLKAPSWIVDNTSSFSSIKLLVVPLCCVQGGFYLMIIYIYDILSITTNKHFGKCMFAKVRHFILF